MSRGLIAQSSRWIAPEIAAVMGLARTGGYAIVMVNSPDWPVTDLVLIVRATALGTVCVCSESVLVYASGADLVAPFPQNPVRMIAVVMEYATAGSVSVSERMVAKIVEMSVQTTVLDEESVSMETAYAVVVGQERHVTLRKGVQMIAMLVAIVLMGFVLAQWGTPGTIVVSLPMLHCFQQHVTPFS